MAGFDPSVISQIPDMGPNPMAAKQQAYSLAGVIDQQQLGHLQLKQAQDSEKERMAVKDVLTKNPVDYSTPEGVTKAAEKIAKVSPDYAMKFMKQAQEYQTGAVEQKLAALKLADEQQGSIVGAIDPIVSQLQAMEKSGATPAALNASARALAGPAIQQLMEARPDLKPMLAKINPAALDYQKLVSMERQSKQGQAMLKERLSEYQQRDRERKTDIAEQRAEANERNIASLVASRDQKTKDQEAGVIPPEDLKFTVGQYLAGDRQAFQGLGSTRTTAGMKNWAAARKELREQATAEAKTRGIEAKDAPRYVAQKMASFEALKAEEKAVGTRQAQIELAATEFYSKDPETGEEHGVSKVALDASKNVKRGDWVPVNKLLQDVDKWKSNPPLYAFAQSLDSAVNVYARAMTPVGVPTDASRQRALDKLSTAQGPGAIKAVFDIMNKEIAQAQYAPDAVRETIMSSYMKSGPKGGAAKEPAAPKASAPVEMGGKKYKKNANGNWEEVSG